jgi:hypothetical protein
VIASRDLDGLPCDGVVAREFLEVQGEISRRFPEVDLSGVTRLEACVANKFRPGEYGSFFAGKR